MANGLISYINHIDASGTIITTDSELIAQPVANIADRVVQRRWSTVAGTATLQVDFGADVPIGFLGLFGVSFGPSDTVRHRLSSVSMGAGEVLDTTALASGVVSGYDQSPYVLPSDVTARYWQCDIDAAAPFYVGRAWAGPTWRFQINYSFGASEDEIDASTVTIAERSGVAYVDIGPTFRTAAISLDSMTVADRAQARAMVKAVGRRGQLVFVPDPDSPDISMEVLLARIDTASPISEQFNDRFSKAIGLIEEK
jgi:hypothetical protein